MALPLKNIFGRLPITRYVSWISLRGLCSKTDSSVPFNEELLKVLVCPLTKKPLRYNSSTNELISDTVGVAYPVRNGIPNLVPQDARMINVDGQADTKS